MYVVENAKVYGRAFNFREFVKTAFEYSEGQRSVSFFYFYVTVSRGKL